MTDFQERMVVELSELQACKSKLLAALTKEGFEEKVGTKQFYLMKWQYDAMNSYYNALFARCEDMGLLGGLAG